MCSFRINTGGRASRLAHERSERTGKYLVTTS